MGRLRVAAACLCHAREKSSRPLCWLRVLDSTRGGPGRHDHAVRAHNYKAGVRGLAGIHGHGRRATARGTAARVASRRGAAVFASSRARRSRGWMDGNAHEPCARRLVYVQNVMLHTVGTGHRMGLLARKLFRLAPAGAAPVNRVMSRAGQLLPLVLEASSFVCSPNGLKMTAPESEQARCSLELVPVPMCHAHTHGHGRIQKVGYRGHSILFLEKTSKRIMDSGTLHLLYCNLKPKIEFYMDTFVKSYRVGVRNYECIAPSLLSTWKATSSRLASNYFRMRHEEPIGAWSWALGYGR